MPTNPVALADATSLLAEYRLVVEMWASYRFCCSDTPSNAKLDRMLAKCDDATSDLVKRYGLVFKESELFDPKPCNCGTGPKEHMLGKHPDCEYNDHHCPACHDRKLCTSTACVAPVPPPVCTGSETTPTDYQYGLTVQTIGTCGICQQRVAAISTPLRTFVVTHPYKPMVSR